MADKNTVRPLFVALADHVLDKRDGVLTMINPTTALTAPSGMGERQWLASRFHVHTLLTCYQPGNVNLSQDTGINESIVLLVRWYGSEAKPPTRIIALDKLPHDEAELGDLHHRLRATRSGDLGGGWGEVSTWPLDRIAAGDWSAASWRSPLLAHAALTFAQDAALPLIRIADAPGPVGACDRPCAARCFSPCSTRRGWRVTDSKIRGC